VQCANCKANLPDTAKFCSQCGAKVGVRLCPNGHVLDTDSDICRYCPPTKNISTKKVSASTKVEKTTTIEKPTVIEKTTSFESPITHEEQKTMVFDRTRIYTEKESEPSKLMGWLVIIEGDNKWKDYKIMKSRMSIGRNKDCDISIDDPHISARQASIRVADDIITITDLDSSNGTYVNGQEITKVELKNNDLIKMGDTVLKFKTF